MKKQLLFNALFLFAITFAKAQCDNFLSTAIPSGDTLHCQGGNLYKTAVAYHPVYQLYYSVNAGGATPNETFNSNGQQIGTSTAVDYRGLWWNPNDSVIEGNTWDNFFAIDSLQPDGSLGGSINSFPGNTSPPNLQAAGAYDASQDLIYYYDSGILYGESRTGFVDITPITLTGVSTTDVLNATLFYYDCPGKEIVLFDNGSLTRRLLFFNKSTGAFAAAIGIPSSAGAIAHLNGNLAYANGLLWLFDNSINKWIGYTFQTPVGINEQKQQAISIYPNPTSSTLNIEVKERTQITIVNVLGKVVKAETINGLSSLDVTELSTGVYFIQSNTGIKKKFIKQ